MKADVVQLHGVAEAGTWACGSPLVIEQLPPDSIRHPGERDRLRVVRIRTVIVPVTFQSLSVPWVVGHRHRVGEGRRDPAATFRVAGSTLDVAPQVNVRVNVACAVFVTVRSAAAPVTQTSTERLSEPVVPVVSVVKVAVFGWLVQVPAGSPLKPCW